MLDEKQIFNFEADEEPVVYSEFENEDLDEVDFSELAGKNKFKKSFSQAKKKVAIATKKRQSAPLKTKKVFNKNVPLKNGSVAKINSPTKKKISKVIAPSNYNVIIKSVDKFILSDEWDWMKNLSVYKGERLKNVVLNFDNSNSAFDVTLDLFDPSSRMDWFFSNTQDINSVITVAGSQVRYSDILNNLLANPLMIVNCRMNITGIDVSGQINQSIFVKNKNSEGWYKVNPISMATQIDVMQSQRNIVTFNMTENLNRPYIADGMDVLQYKVLAGNSVSFSFYYKQFLLKKLLFEEAVKSRLLL